MAGRGGRKDGNNGATKRKRKYVRVGERRLRYGRGRRYKGGEK